mmetsp:Transcript_24755/g.74388  ORF Transcript_24755/g.74388 Transcript_24755/m.74388 type:complete len:255 (+) Transcript_24755:439-1203(+)
MVAPSRLSHSWSFRGPTTSSGASSEAITLARSIRIDTSPRWWSACMCVMNATRRFRSASGRPSPYLRYMLPRVPSPASSRAIHPGTFESSVAHVLKRMPDTLRYRPGTAEAVPRSVIAASEAGPLGSAAAAPSASPATRDRKPLQASTTPGIALTASTALATSGRAGTSCSHCSCLPRNAKKRVCSPPATQPSGTPPAPAVPSAENGRGNASGCTACIWYCRSATLANASSGEQADRLTTTCCAAGAAVSNHAT